VSLRHQLDASSEELSEAGRGREIALRENRRIQDDMALMTRENQVTVMSLVNFSTELQDSTDLLVEFIQKVKRVKL